MKLISILVTLFLVSCAGHKVIYNGESAYVASCKGIDQCREKAERSCPAGYKALGSIGHGNDKWSYYFNCYQISEDGTVDKASRKSKVSTGCLRRNLTGEIINQCENKPNAE